jgi:hypothetical protein
VARRGASGAECDKNVGLATQRHRHDPPRSTAARVRDPPSSARQTTTTAPARAASSRAPNDIIMSSITFDTLHTNTDQSNHIEHQATTSTTDVAPHGASWNKMQTHRRPCAPLPTAEKNEPASRSLARAPVSPSSDLLTEELWVSSSFTRSSAVLPLVPCCGVVVRLSGADVAPPCSPVVLLPETGRVCPSHAYLASATCACRDRIRPLE